MHPLLVIAQEQSRRIYASLPWGYRVAGLMLHLASSLTDTFGRAAYLAFVQAGVPDLPPINGETPDRGLKKVPPGYGKRFGDKVYAQLLSKSRNLDMVEDVLSSVMIKLAEGKMALRPNASLREAESYVTQMAVNELKSAWRRIQDRHEQPSSPDAEDGDPIINLDDPRSFQQLDDLIPKSELAQLMQALGQINEKAPSWLAAKLDGLTGVEISREWGVGKSRITAWEQNYVPRIKRMLTHYIQEAS